MLSNRERARTYRCGISDYAGARSWMIGFGFKNNAIQVELMKKGKLLFHWFVLNLTVLANETTHREMHRWKFVGDDLH